MSMGELSSDKDSFVPADVPIGGEMSQELDSDAMVAWLLQQKDILAKIDEGRRQLDAGEYVSMNEEELRQFFEGMKQRIRDRAASS
jgi:hypothetical protein